MDRNKIDSEIKALQSGFAGNDAIYMGKRNGIEVGYLAAVKKYEGSIADLQAKCERYEKALNEIMDKSIDPDNDDAPAATLYGINLAATEALAGDGENKEPEKEIEYMPVHPEDARKPNCPKQFPMHLLNEAKAQSNHSQSLKRLKERGGLSVAEILAIVGNKPWNYYGCLKWEDKLKMLNELLNQKEDGQ